MKGKGARYHSKEFSWLVGRVHLIQKCDRPHFGQHTTLKQFNQQDALDGNIDQYYRRRFKGEVQ